MFNTNLIDSYYLLIIFYCSIKAKGLGTLHRKRLGGVFRDFELLLERLLQAGPLWTARAKRGAPHLSHLLSHFESFRIFFVHVSTPNDGRGALLRSDLTRDLHFSILHLQKLQT